jgi:hypothetical protein
MTAAPVRNDPPTIGGDVDKLSALAHFNEARARLGAAGVCLAAWSLGLQGLARSPLDAKPFEQCNDLMAAGVAKKADRQATDHVAMEVAEARGDAVTAHPCRRHDRECRGEDEVSLHSFTGCHSMSGGEFLIKSLFSEYIGHAERVLRNTPAFDVIDA